MRTITILIIAMISMASCKNQINKIDKSRILRTDSTGIVILYNGQVIPWSIEKEDINISYSPDTHNVGFATPTDTVSFILNPSDTFNVSFIIADRDTISMNVIGAPNAASFDQKYIEEHKGTYKVFAPEVHELVNICVALTYEGRRDSNMVEMTTAYYQEVISHFEQYQGHPLIDTINNYFSSDNDDIYDYYYNIRMNANIYTFDEDKIVNKSPYSRFAWGGDNYITELLPLLEDFAITSGFRQFHKDHKDYYQSLIDSYYELVPVNKMWTWVENKFPNRFQAYKVYFSPLINGAHAANKFTDNDFNESIMYVNAPILSDLYSSKEKEAYLSRMVFTEIDHNYVNPMTDEFPEASSSINPIKCWNNNESQWYGNGYATFNEYMTYAIFTLYMYDNFDAETFETINEANNGLMTRGRGFIKFKEFNAFVLDWYKENREEPLRKLYPKVIEWMKSVDCK